jgi:hypothetical protein
MRITAAIFIAAGKTRDLPVLRGLIVLFITQWTRKVVSRLSEEL